MVICGTRMEAIKMAPLIGELELSPLFTPMVTVTGQGGVRGLLAAQRPDAVVMRGASTTAYAAALAAFYEKIPVVHLAAGLRIDDPYSADPEEINRWLASQLAALHLAPTAASKATLVAGNVHPATVVVTGTFADEDGQAARRTVAALAHYFGLGPAPSEFGSTAGQSELPQQPWAAAAGPAAPGSLGEEPRQLIPGRPGGRPMAGHRPGGRGVRVPHSKFGCLSAAESG
jgi:hypothetical protein